MEQRPWKNSSFRDLIHLIFKSMTKLLFTTVMQIKTVASSWGPDPASAFNKPVEWATRKESVEIWNL